MIRCHYLDQCSDWMQWLNVFGLDQCSDWMFLVAVPVRSMSDHSVPTNIRIYCNDPSGGTTAHLCKQAWKRTLGEVDLVAFLNVILHVVSSDPVPLSGWSDFCVTFSVVVFLEENSVTTIFARCDKRLITPWWQSTETTAWKSAWPLFMLPWWGMICPGMQLQMRSTVTYHNIIIL